MKVKDSLIFFIFIRKFHLQFCFVKFFGIAQIVYLYMMLVLQVQLLASING